MKKTCKKIMAIFLAIIALILCLVFCLSGCRIGTYYEKGTFGVRVHMPAIPMGVKSQTNIFSIDDVTLDLYYALYDNAYPNPEANYTPHTVTGFTFGLYICDKDLKFVPKHGEIIDDLKNIENQYFVKEITEEEFYNGYGYYHNKASGKLTYDHKEEITIPKEFFDKESGTVLIKIWHYGISDEYEGKYKSYLGNIVSIGYEKIDENTVKLK